MTRAQPLARGTFLTALVLATTGCATVTPLPSREVAVVPTLPQINAPEGFRYTDYVGVIHIHTRYSDGAGTVEEIARIANRQQLDYLLVTDHNTLAPLTEGKQGWYGMVLVLVGTELSTRGGHLLAFNITETIDRHALTTQQIIDAVHRQGGLSFIAHPYFKKRRWTDWAVTGFTGIEVYNVAHDTLDEHRLRLVLWALSVHAEPFYRSLIDRPYDALAKWDALWANRGPVVGIGASDAHEKRLGVLKVAPYAVLFQFVRTHLLVPSTPLTADAVYEALRRGHTYFAIELLAAAKGFTFFAKHQEQIVGLMGDTIALVEPLRLVATVPTPADLVLFKDGEPIAHTTASTWEIPISTPGVYRLEATVHNTPWIFSNPIHVREY